MIDFTNCKKILSKAYNGANGKKIAIEYDGKQYMLKFPPSGKEKPTELSYTNSCFSEHIGSSIFNLVGIPAQKTLLGTYDFGEKTKIVCACLDFTTGGKQLFDFCSIKNTVIDSESNGSGTELDELEETIEKQTFIDPIELTERFWDMFVIDAFLGNFDRHNGNWGFLVDLKSNKAEVAPVFDCGSCLLPQADEKVMKAVLANEDELNARVYQFPTSALKVKNRKINYYDFLMKAGHPDCNAAVLRRVPQINMDKIRDFIQNVPYISELQKEFYRTYLAARFEKMMLPSLSCATKNR